MNCLLLSGSGLPDAYQKAGQLTCWRNLACTLPLGLTMVKTKKELFYILLKSILQNNDKSNTHNKINEDSVYILMKEYIVDNTDDLENVLPNLILNKLHRVLLLMGFNELGLSVVISVLGKLASLECRPRMIYNNNMPTTEPVNTSYRYEVPEDEVSLIKCIMRIIFGVSKIFDNFQVVHSLYIYIICDGLLFYDNCFTCLIHHFKQTIISRLQRGLYIISSDKHMSAIMQLLRYEYSSSLWSRNLYF